MSDKEAVQRAIELLLNSLYPGQRGEVLRSLWSLYNMDAKPHQPVTRTESCRRCATVTTLNGYGFCGVCGAL